MADFLFQPTPHEDAAKLIADKPVVVRSVFDEMLPEFKGRAFTITGIEVANVLQSVRDRLADLPQGGDWHTIKNDIANEVSPFLDDTTKTAVENRAAAEARAELLLRVHGFQAYSACNERLIERQKDVFPFCEYVTVGDGHVRASHAALDGKIIPTNSDFWKTHTPPWGWGCRCQKVPRTAADVGAIQKKEAKLPPENQNVVTGPRLVRLEQGHLELGPSSSINIAPPTGPGAFVSTPGDMRIPLDELKARYDAPIWNQFEAYAKRTEIPELKKSVWAWLSETGRGTGVPPVAAVTAAPLMTSEEAAKFATSHPHDPGVKLVNQYVKDEDYKTINAAPADPRAVALTEFVANLAPDESATVLYRGIEMPDQHQRDQLVAQIRADGVFKNTRTLMSTSKNINEATYRAADEATGVFFEIQTPVTARNLEPLVHALGHEAMAAKEAERVFLNGATFELVRIEELEIPVYVKDKTGQQIIRVPKIVLREVVL